MLKRILNELKYDQKKHWDSIAFSYFKSCSKIVDLGCGEGRFIEQDKDRIIGVDWNENSLSICKEKGFNVIKSDIRNLPLQNESIDAIHCAHVIEHFMPEDVHKILSEMDRVLKKNGFLIIISPLLWDGFYSDLTHIRPYNPNVIIRYLTPGPQRTLPNISKSYKIILIKWRYFKIQIGISVFNVLFNFLNRLGFPWLKKTGYMLIMQKQ